jgi:hypothetical protein
MLIMFAVFRGEGDEAGRLDRPTGADATGTGEWVVDAVKPVLGEVLPSIGRLVIAQAGEMPARGAPWPLVGVASNGRYTTAKEKAELDARQAGLGRPGATCGVLIPIRKSAGWWALTQDARRAIFEEQSAHIGGSMKFLPAVARKLYHSRDLGEPFDFLTWFEFAPEAAGGFDELLGFLRGTVEWHYVEREVEIRVRRT